jgi:ERCC4-type nuclease
MIIEDTGEQTKAKNYVGKIFTKNKIPFIRREIKFNDERVGDYLGEYTDEKGNFFYTWILERKKDQDFVNSVVDGSLEKQLEKMLMLFPGGGKYIAFEGDWEQTLKLNPLVRGLLLSMRYKCAWYGATFVICKNNTETAAFIASIHKYCRPFTEIKIGLYKPNISKEKDERIRNLITVPGIHIKTAKLILEHIKSISEIAKAAKSNPSKLINIKGIGKKTVENINNMYNSKEAFFYEKKGKGNIRSKRCNAKGNSKVHAKSYAKYINNAGVYGRRKNNRNTKNH